MAYQLTRRRWHFVAECSNLLISKYADIAPDYQATQLILRLSTISLPHPVSPKKFCISKRRVNVLYTYYDSYRDHRDSRIIPFIGEEKEEKITKFINVLFLLVRRASL